MASDAPPRELPEWDLPQLLAQLRSGAADRERIVAQMYARTFRTEAGRLVLLHHLQACGVGRMFGPHQTDAELRYSAGMHDAAVQLANDAGFDDAALAATLLNNNELIEEPDHGRPSTDPGAVFDDPDDL